LGAKWAGFVTGKGTGPGRRETLVKTTKGDEFQGVKVGRPLKGKKMGDEIVGGEKLRGLKGPRNVEKQAAAPRGENGVKNTIRQNQWGKLNFDHDVKKKGREAWDRRGEGKEGGRVF